MLKKVLSVCLSIALVFCMVAGFSGCGAKASEGSKKYGYSHTDKENMISFISNFAKTQGDGTKSKAEKLLSSLGEDYDSYIENKTRVTDFMAEATTTTDDIFAAYKYVCIDYCKLIAQEDLDYYDYDGALESLSNAIKKGLKGYCGTLDGAIDDIYNKCKYLIGTAKNEVSYDTLTKEADEIYDILSDGYESIYDKAYEYYDYIYELILEISDNFSDGKKDVDLIVENFKTTIVESTTKQIEEKTTLGNKTNESASKNSEQKNDDFATLEEAILKYVDDEISGLSGKFTQLSSKIDSYDKYVKNVADVDAFYEEIINKSKAISVKLCEYSIEYAEMILDSNMSTDDMYDAFDGLYECIYDDAADALYDGIYDGILKDMYDTFYDGVISDGMDIVAYKDWYDTSSKAYELYADISSDCYEHWFDMRSDVYGFLCDVKAEVFSKDIQGAKDEIADFKDDVKKMQE